MVPSVGLANSCGTGAPSDRATDPASMFPPSTCTIWSLVPHSYSENVLSPVRRNFTTLQDGWGNREIWTRPCYLWGHNHSLVYFQVQYAGTNWTPCCSGVWYRNSGILALFTGELLQCWVNECLMTHRSCRQNRADQTKHHSETTKVRYNRPWMCYQDNRRTSCLSKNQA